MRVSRLVAVLGCLVVAGCAAGPAGSTTAGTTTSSSAASTPATAAPATTAPATTAPATTAPATTAPATTAPATTAPATRPTCTGSPGFAPDGPRLTATSTVTGAWVCRGTTPSVATPAQARALADALAQPTPPKRKVLCADNIRFNAPTWYLTTASGQVIRPAAPKDSCGQPIAAVQLAVAAITAG